MKNTRIVYLYRDASNYKQYNEVIVRGRITSEDVAGYLYDGQFFIPFEVGLKDLQGCFADQGFDYPSIDDHEWHEFVGFEVTDAEATVNVSASEIVASFVKLKS